jgi:hypothetical protein
MQPSYATIGQNLVFLRGFSGNSFASLSNRARARRRARARMASQACCAFVEPVLFRMEAHEQFGQHRYDANQHFFAGLNSIQRGKSFGHRSSQLASIEFFVVEVRRRNLAKTACRATGLALVIRPQNVGGIAQLVERLVRNEKARGSNPLTSTPQK